MMKVNSTFGMQISIYIVPLKMLGTGKGGDAANHKHCLLKGIICSLQQKNFSRDMCWGDKMETCWLSLLTLTFVDFATLYYGL